MANVLTTNQIDRLNRRVDLENLIGIGFCQPKFYKPAVWQRADRVMQKLCELTESSVRRHDFGRGKGKYIKDDEQSHRQLAELYLRNWK